MRRTLRMVGLSVVAASVAALLLAGCTAASPLALTSAASGSSQALDVGQQVTVTLDSNPTTGYRWALDGPMPAQLEQVGEPKYTAGSSAIGAGGTEAWTFVAKKRGTATLALKYWRSFEPTATPPARFTVDIQVR